MCAAPGGKATHIAQKMGQVDRSPLTDSFTFSNSCHQGCVIALDRSSKKVDRLIANIKKTGLEGVVHAYVADARKILDRSLSSMDRGLILDCPPSSSSKKMGLAFGPCSFDRVLLDPPCSGLGLRPQLKDDATTLRELNNIVEYQKALFSVAAELVCTGGYLAYSTCTINPSENEEMVSWALNLFHDLELVAPENPALLVGQPGLKNCGLGDHQRHLVQRFDPSDSVLDCNGFFIALFRKS